jgi:hypothetical protein
MADPDKQIARAQGGHNIGGAWQQGNNAWSVGKWHGHLLIIVVVLFLKITKRTGSVKRG